MRRSTEIVVGGFVPLSTVDWPDQLVATVFTQGCPWDCPYCHNPDLRPVVAASATAPDWCAVLDFLDARTGLLDGVVFSGGEPLTQVGLAEAIKDVRSRGFGIGLHTGGVSPGRFAEVLPLVDWVGFDVKAPFAEYVRVTGAAGSGGRAHESLRALVASGVAFEARTTVHPDLLSSADLVLMADELVAEGVRHWALQTFRADGVRPGLVERPAVDLLPMGTLFAPRFEGFTIR